MSEQAPESGPARLRAAETIRIEPVDPRRDAQGQPTRLADCLAIRREVFTLGQGVPEALEFDGLDDEADHFLALSGPEGEQRPVGTARMRIVEGAAKAERVAVREPCRGRGIGRALMAAIEDRARACACHRVVLNAQTPVVPFYEDLGYEPQGPVFEEAGIPHRAMQKRLAQRR